jgi:hypothetical protein
MKSLPVVNIIGNLNLKISIYLCKFDYKCNFKIDAIKDVVKIIKRGTLYE